MTGARYSLTTRTKQPIEEALDETANKAELLTCLMPLFYGTWNANICHIYRKHIKALMSFLLNLSCN